MDYVVELSDDDGKSCRIALSIPFFASQTDPTNSTWRVLDEGFIKYRSGGCVAVEYSPRQSSNLFLIRSRKQSKQGIWLSEVISPLLGTINNSGDGGVEQEWCVGFKPGKITWAVLEG